MLTTIRCLQSEFHSACTSPLIASLPQHTMYSTYIVAAYLYYVYTYIPLFLLSLHHHPRHQYHTLRPTFSHTFMLHFLSCPQHPSPLSTLTSPISFTLIIIYNLILPTLRLLSVSDFYPRSALFPCLIIFSFRVIIVITFLTHLSHYQQL